MLFLISLTIGLVLGAVVFVLIVTLDRSLQNVARHNVAKGQNLQTRRGLELDTSY